MKSAGKNKRPLPTPSRDAPVFGSPFEQRRLRFLNALFLALARGDGKAEVRGREAREINITIHQTGLSISLDRPATRRGKGVGPDAGDQLRFCHSCQVRP
jgi:hypothetical protein